MDILSCLPDEVISHILSFLPTKCSAQTSVLSKRWKLLWAHVPLLEFEVNHPDKGDDYLLCESLDCILSGCLALEELSIDGLVLGHCCFSSPILTSLDLEIVNDEISEFGVNLDTPALRYLRLHFSVPDKFSVGALDSLIEADINLSWDEPHQDRFTYSRHLLELVCKLYNVKFLTLSTPRMTAIHGTSFFALPIMFQNLTKLRLGSNLGFTKFFLENASNLQVIELIYIKADTDNQDCWTDPKRVPECLISHLRIVVCYFGCSKHEFDMLRYILMNAKVLKRMEVHTRHLNDSMKKSKALTTIALFERGSLECHLVCD